MGLLLELFTKEGRGTLLSQDTLEELRTAGINDVGEILNLIRPLEEAGVLVEGSRDLLETEISNFLVVELEGNIIGCAALFIRRVRNPARSPVSPSTPTTREESSAAVSYPSCKGKRNSRTSPTCMR